MANKSFQMLKNKHLWMNTNQLEGSLIYMSVNSFSIKFGAKLCTHNLMRLKTKSKNVKLRIVTKQNTNKKLI